MLKFKIELFIFLGVLNLFAIANIKSYIVSANVLINPETNQKVVIYGDTHGKIDPQVSINQAELICNKIKEAVKNAKKNNHKLTVLYEGIVPAWRLNYLKKDMPHHFLIYLTEFANSFKDVIFNIDNRNHIHSYKDCLDYKFMVNEFQKRLESQIGTNEGELLKKDIEAINKELKEIPFGNKDLNVVCQMYLEERKSCFVNLQKKLNQNINQISSDFFKKLLDAVNKSEEDSILESKNDIERFYHSDHSRTCTLLDVNALIHVLTNPTSTIIIFAGGKHTGRIMDMLKTFNYTEIYCSHPAVLFSEEMNLAQGNITEELRYDNNTSELKKYYRYINLDDLIPDFDYIVKYVK